MWPGEANAHDDIAREAHTLTGSARSFGAIDLADSLEAIESAARKTCTGECVAGNAGTGQQM